MMKKTVVICAALTMVLALSACGNSAEHTGSEPEGTPSDSTDSKNNVSAATRPESDLDSSILIAYFSWSGNTKQLASDIQEQIGGDLFQIEMETPYTDDIGELSGFALQEQRDDARPALSTHVEDMGNYEVVFIGYPNWWSDAPMPVFTFLEEYDFSGKTVIPFTTYGDGGFGKSVASIQETLSNVTMLEGLAIQEHELGDASVKVAEWLQVLGYLQ